ncbi:MAG: T9SS type A sorting domain-containing protein [candidate division WOR-3 bacterium]
MTLALEGWVHYKPKISYQPERYVFLTNITKIAEDKEKNIIYFASHTNGIDVLYPDGTWKRLDYRNTPLPEFNEFINDIVIYKSKLFAGTRKGLLFLSDKDTILYNVLNSQLPNDYITNLAVDNNGIIYLSSHQWNEITKISGNSFEKIVLPEYVPFVSYTKGSQMTCDKRNNLWYVWLKALVFFDGSNFYVWDSTNSPLREFDYIDYFYYSENDDHIYISCSPFANSDTIKGGTRLFKINTFSKEWSEIDLTSTQLDLRKIKIRLISKDKSNNLIFAFSSRETQIDYIQSSLIVLNSSNKYFYTIEIPTEELIGIDFVPLSYLFVDNNNVLYIGTSQNGVIKCDLDLILKGASRTEVVKSALPNLWIRNVYPNPVKSLTIIEFFCIPHYRLNLMVKIFNPLGIEVLDITNLINYDFNTASGTIKLDLHSLSSGIYYINFKANEENKSVGIVKY